MNNDLISRSALKKAIMNDLGLGDEENGSDAEYMSGLQDCYNLIDNAPAVPTCSQELGCEICVNRNIKSKEACTSPFGVCKFFNCGSDMEKAERNE